MGRGKIPPKSVQLSPAYSVYVSYHGETNSNSNSIFLLVKVGKCLRRLNLWSNASRLSRHLLLKLMGMIQSTDQASHFSLNYQASNMSLTNFVDQFSAFRSLSDFNVTTLKWTDLDQDVVYQITSTRTINTQHGPSVILSLQKGDGSSCSAWACGMLSKELLQNPMIMVSFRLFVLVTGKKTSKANGRVYNSYKLVTL